MSASPRHSIAMALSGALLLGGTPQQAEAEVVTQELPELIGEFIHGQDPLSGFFAFANVHAINSLTLTLTATGTAGADVTAWPIPAEIVLDVPGEYLDFEPLVLGPYGSVPATSVHDIPTEPVGFLDCIGCPQFYTMTGEIELSTNDIYPSLILPPTVLITEAYMTLDAEFCNHPTEPIGCGGFIGIGTLNTVLSNWNLNVPPGDPAADFSGDGYVGIDDLNWVLSRWNNGTPPAASTVPEPVSLALMGMAGLYMLRRP